MLLKLYLTRVYRINTARVSAPLVEAYAGCLCACTCRYIDMYVCVRALACTEYREE